MSSLEEAVIIKNISEIICTSHYDQGVQISFNLLVTLAAIERSVVFKDGLILLNFCTALIPVKVINEFEQLIQWHLIVREL